MEIPATLIHTARMNKEQCEDLFETAVNLAYQAFDNVTDDHVQAIYDRLVWNAYVGLDVQGAVTVH